MEQFKSEVTKTVAVLKKASADIENIMLDPELEHLKNRLLRVLDKEISTISLQHGLEYKSLIQEEPTQFAPLTILMGRELKAVPAATAETQLLDDSKPAQQKPNQQTAEELEAAEMKEKTLELYSKFTDIEAEPLLDQFEENIIRGVAKLAGLPATKEFPKKVDEKFILEIKAAIKAKGQIDDAAKKLEEEKQQQQTANQQNTNQQAADKANTKQSDSKANEKK